MVLWCEKESWVCWPCPGMVVFFVFFMFNTLLNTYFCLVCCVGTEWDLKEKHFFGFGSFFFVPSYFFRAFGDVDSKPTHPNSTLGTYGGRYTGDFVISTPYITSQPITESTEFVVLACDGLFDVMTYVTSVCMLHVGGIRDFPSRSQVSKYRACTEAFVVLLFDLCLSPWALMTNANVVFSVLLNVVQVPRSDWHCTHVVAREWGCGRRVWNIGEACVEERNHGQRQCLDHLFEPIAGCTCTAAPQGVPG